MRKLLPFFSLLLSLNTNATGGIEVAVGDENTPPQFYTSSQVLGTIALKLRSGKTDYPKYLSFFKEIAQAGNMSTKDALKITLLLQEMGCEDKVERMIEKLQYRSISPDTARSLEHFSQELLGKPYAFEFLTRKIREVKNPFYTSPGSDEGDFYNSRERKKRPRFASPESRSNGNDRKRSDGTQRLDFTE